MAMSEMDYMSGGGGNVYTETRVISSMGEQTVNCGFKPKYITVSKGYSNGIENAYIQMYYNEDVSDSKQTQAYYYSNSNEISALNIPATGAGAINRLTSNGFVFSVGAQWTGTYYIVCGA